MNTDTLHLTDYRAGFAHGETTITRHDAADDPVGLGVGVLRLRAGERLEQAAAVETAWLLMDGRIHGTAGGRPFEFERRSLFDESASCAHVSAGLVPGLVRDAAGFPCRGDHRDRSRPARQHDA